MKSPKKVLSALICFVLICGVFSQVLPSGTVMASGSPGYTIAVPPSFDGEGRQFNDGLAPVENGGKFGLIDKTGRVVVDFVYDGLGATNHPAKNSIGANYYIAVQHGKSGILDRNGKPVVPCEYDSISITKQGFALLGKGRTVPPGLGAIEGLWGLRNLHTDREILPVKYNGILASDDSLVFTVVYNSKTGVVDRAGKFVVPLGTFDYIGGFNSGYAMVEKNNKRGFINEAGKIVVPVTYDDIPNGFISGFGIARKGNKVGVINTSGKTVVPFKYDDGTVFANSVISLRQGFKTAIMSQSGTVVAPAGKYDFVYAVEGNLIFVGQGGKVDEKGYKWGLIDSKGNTVIKREFDSIVYMGQGYFQVRNQKGCAVFNEGGEVVVPFGDFDLIGFYISENMVNVSKSGLTGYINLPEYVAPPDAWAKPEVNRAVAAGLVPEDMQRIYQDNITRADFCRLGRQNNQTRCCRHVTANG